MNILGIIPARFSSSRFPGKPLIDLNGKSMIQRVYEGASQSKLIQKLIVATDDKRIFDEVLNFGGEAVMTSPNHNTGTDRCCEVLRMFPNHDIVINIQGDEPLVNHRQLDLLLSSFDDKNTEIATLGKGERNLDFLKNPNRIKIVVNSTNEALYFSRSEIPFSQNNCDFPYLRHIGLYAFRSKTLNEISKLNLCLLEKKESLEQLRWLFYGFKIKVIETDIETPNIDSPDDVETVLKILREHE